MNRTRFNSFPWYGKIGLVLGWIFVAVPSIVIVVLALGPPVTLLVAVGSVRELCLPIRMGFRRRYIPSWELRRQICHDDGTLIIESPTIGWGITRAWWTAEDVVACSPFREPTQEEYKAKLSQVEEPTESRALDWDRWCWENYTRLDCGRAMLARAWNGKSLEARLSRAFPKMKIVHTWTGLVHEPLPATGVVSRWFWMRDRVALVGCALLVFVEIFSAMLLIAWLSS